MRLGYDNLEDARSKLQSTFCLYRRHAVVIKTVDALDTSYKKFEALATSVSTGRTSQFNLDDPDFDCYNFNLGYMNLYAGESRIAPWFYRLPIKQYRQGLRYDQVTARMSTGNMGFPWNAVFKGNPLAAMLENRYPSIEEAAESLSDPEVKVAAFHRNFALSKDKLRGDFTIEYKGKQVGFTSDLKRFQFPETHDHLKEHLNHSLQRAVA